VIGFETKDVAREKADLKFTKGGNKEMGMMDIRRMAQKLLAPLVIVLVVAMTVGLFYIGFPKSHTTTGAYQGPSLKIDGKKIRDAQFNEYMNRANQQAQQYAQYGMQFSQAQIRDSAVKMAISEYAIQKEIKKLKLKGLDKEAEKLIKKYLPTEEELQSYMERQNVSSKAELVKNIVKTLEQQKLYVYNAKKAKMKASKAEVEGYMEEITVKHILIGLKNQEGKDLRNDAQALQRAEEVYKKLTAKGDFAKLAKEYSDDPGSKDKGGVIGPMPVQQFKSSMVKEFVDGALALKPGEISKPVKTTYGYHLIQLEKRSMPKGNDYKEKYAEISESLLVQKYTQSSNYSKWIEKLTTAAETKMEILDPAIRAYRLVQKEKWEEAAKAYEKALKHKYYKRQWDLYLEAAKAYTKAKQYSAAQAVLKKVSAEYQDMIDYQITLATIYKENKQPQKATKVLQAFSSKHAQEMNVHQQLQQQFTEWKMKAAADQEAVIIAKLQKKEAAELEKYQKQMDQKNAKPQASAQP
jgi:parvulin-like peptidyl-prolyl isomerase